MAGEKPEQEAGRLSAGQEGAGHPQPQLQPLPQGPPTGGADGVLGQLLAGRSGIGLAAACLVAVAAWSSGILPGFGPTTPKPPIENMKGQAVPGGYSMIAAVAAPQFEAAIALLTVSEADKANVRAGLASGKLRIGLVTVSDFDAEDGDWVSVVAAGFRQDLPLFKKPTTIAVPYLPGTGVAVTGLVDGGGGDITVAIHVGASVLPLRAIKRGESVMVPTP